MDLSFDQGNQTEPKGHAILYYRAGSEILATYVIVLPLTVDFAKYIPPVMASQVKAQGMEEFSAFAIPPVPEEVQGYESLENLARLRGDDLVFGGEVRDNDFLEAAQRVNDAGPGLCSDLPATGRGGPRNRSIGAGTLRPQRRRGRFLPDER